VRLIATITVDYSRNGVSLGELKDILSASIDSLVADGGFTGETPAEVASWNYSIIEGRDE
jgi:hypothetical protein